MLVDSKYTKTKLVFSRWLVFLVSVGVQFDLFKVGGLSLVSAVIILYFINCISFLQKSNGYFQKYRKFIFPLVLFIILLTIMNIININYYSSRFIPTSILIGIVLFIFSLAHVSEDPKAANFIIAGILFGGLLMSVFFMLGIGLELDVEDGNRLTMFGLNSNNLGCLMCISVAIVLSEVIIKDMLNLKILRYVFVLIIILFVSFIFATASRTAFGCLMFIIATVFLWSPFVGRKRTRLFFVVLLLIGLYYGYRYFLESDLLYNRILLSIEEADSSGRQSIWRRLWPLVLEHPLGIGETGYTLYAKENFNTTAIASKASPHNVLLEVLIYTGFIGLLLYLSFWFKMISTSLKKARFERNILPLLLIEVFTIQMFFGQLLNFRIAWLSFAIIAVSSIEYSTQQDDDLESGYNAYNNTN